MKTSSSRPGLTLVELLLFLGILGMAIAFLPSLLLTTMENRLLQQTEAIVEQNGTQLLQILALRVRQGERVLYPVRGEQGSLLTLQTSSGSTNPTIIGTLSGTMLIIRRATKLELSSRQVAVENFRVRNTSVSHDRPSVHVSFQVSRTIRLQQPHIYRKTFQQTIGLYPDDRPFSDSCGCIAPYCAGNNVYTWRICGAECETASTQITCP